MFTEDKVARDRLETLEGQFRSLKLEWEDTYEKLHRLVQRIAKRTERDLQAAAEAKPEGNGERSRREEVQASIMARRHRVPVSSTGSR